MSPPTSPNSRSRSEGESDAPAEDGAGSWGEARHLVDHRVGRLSARHPSAPSGKRVPEVLAEEARHVPPGGASESSTMLGTSISTMARRTSRLARASHARGP
jgi:hypothetical protein